MTEYFRNIFEGLFSSVMSMRATLGHFFLSFFASEFRSDENAASEMLRGRLYVNWENCIGCRLCAEACPVNCIFIDTIPAAPDEELGITSNGKKKELWVLEFDIDMSKCLFCGLCVHPCPTNCITMTGEQNFSVFNRNNLIYHFTPFTPEQAMKKRKAENKITQYNAQNFGR